MCVIGVLIDPNHRERERERRVDCNWDLRPQGKGHQKICGSWHKEPKLGIVWAGPESNFEVCEPAQNPTRDPIRRYDP